MSDEYAQRLNLVKSGFEHRVKQKTGACSELFFFDNAALVVTTVAVMELCLTSHRLITRSHRLVTESKRTTQSKQAPPKKKQAQNQQNVTYL